MNLYSFFFSALTKFRFNMKQYFKLFNLINKFRKSLSCIFITLFYWANMLDNLVLSHLQNE